MIRRVAPAKANLLAQVIENHERAQARLDVWEQLAEAEILHPDGPDDRDQRIATVRADFAEQNVEMRTSDAFPMTPERILADLRAAMPRDAILTSNVGWNKNGVAQQFDEVSAVPVAPDGLVFDASSVTVEAIRETSRYGGVRVKLAAEADGGSTVCVLHAPERRCLDRARHAQRQVLLTGTRHHHDPDRRRSSGVGSGHGRSRATEVVRDPGVPHHPRVRLGKCLFGCCDAGQ